MRQKCLTVFVVVLFCLAAATVWPQGQYLIRGDVDGDEFVGWDDVTDLTMYINSGIPMNCHNAADVNDDGTVGDIADLNHLVSFLNTGEPPIPEPYPDCGIDETDPLPGEDCCDPGQFFIRGDANGNGRVGWDDYVEIHEYLFASTPMECHNAADVNDDGFIDLNDLYHLGNFLQWGEPPIPEPYPFCGLDPTDPQPGDDCCRRRILTAVPSITLIGALALVVLLIAIGSWFYLRKRTNTVGH